MLNILSCMRSLYKTIGFSLEWKQKQMEKKHNTNQITLFFKVARKR